MQNHQIKLYKIILYHIISFKENMQKAPIPHMEEKKQVYVLIRRIHFLQLVYAFDWISKDQYNNQINELIPKYKNLKNMLKSLCGLQINSFAKEFKIVEEVKVVQNASERALSNQVQGSQKDDVAIFMHATATFIKVNDILAMNQSKPIVMEIRSVVQELVFILRRLRTKLSKQFGNKTIELQNIFQSLQQKQGHDLLSENEFNALQAQVESLYRILQIDVRAR